MDPQSQSFIPYANGNEAWRLQTDLVKMQQLQSEHAERIARLERRQDDDARLKSVWGPSSPFPSVLGGNTPQQGTLHSGTQLERSTNGLLAPLHQPPVDQFRHFDDEAHNMISSLHLDAEEEPRRGLGAASRANSVRFDETANTNHFTHHSRSSGEFISRSSSSLGGLQLTERSASHKSEGRASSQHSLRSAASGRANSLNMDSTFGIPDATRSPLDTPGPAPGLALLGAAPAIIRCWMNTNFKHDALVYAAICSGSYKSFLDLRLIRKLGFESIIRTDDFGVRNVELPVFFPEAVPLTSTSRPSSPAPQLPSLSIDFRVIDASPNDEESKAIQIFIGSDVLRAHNADIHFSSNNITLYDDERNKLSIPMARPENEAAFNSLYVSSGQPSASTLRLKDIHEPTKITPYLNGLGHDSMGGGDPPSASPIPLRNRPTNSLAGEAASVSDSQKPSSPALTHTDFDQPRPLSRQSTASRRARQDILSDNEGSTADRQVSPQSQQPQPVSGQHSQHQQPASVRNAVNPATVSNWRRDEAAAPPSAHAAPGISSSGGALDWGAVASRTRDPNVLPARRDPSGIKVLKPKTASTTTRAFSSTAVPPSSTGIGSSSPAPEGKSSRFFEEGRQRNGGAAEDSKPAATTDARRTAGGGSAVTATTPGSTPKTKSNPVGGASAFSWLNSAMGSAGGGSK